MRTIVSEKGQITIPKAIRDRLGLRPGTILEVEAAGGSLVARKSEPVDIVAKWRGRGRLPSGAAVDDYLRSIRE
jgi:AbrB family looped-hinge helix DNA binding protein